MAPEATSTLLLRTSLQSEASLDLNNNTMKTAQHAVKRPATSAEELNAKSRKLIKNCFCNLRSNLNILVVGVKESGKSSLINSLQMALHQEWKDRAKYNPGKNHTIDQCVLFNNRRQKKDGRGKVVFWDTRGFEEVHSDDRAVLILRYILEGRIPPKCIPCVLLMDKDLIKKRYQKVMTSDRRIDLVLNVSAFVDEPQTRLMSLVQQAITSSKLESVKKLPTVSVVTKCDVLTEQQMKEKMSRLHEYDLENFVQYQRDQQRPSHRRRHYTAPESNAKLIVNYCCELEPWSDEALDPASVRPSVARDTKLLGLWYEIVSRTASFGSSKPRKLSLSPSLRPIPPSPADPPTHKPTLFCLPFTSHSRSRSSSF